MQTRLRIVTFIRKRPGSVQYAVQAATLMPILNPPDHLCILIGEQSGPLPIEAAYQVAWAGNVCEGQSCDSCLIDNEEHEHCEYRPRDVILGSTRDRLRGTQADACQDWENRGRYGRGC